jgi:hypothetical protein
MRDHNEETDIPPAYVAMLAEGVAIMLFISMIAVWAALGAGA